MTSQNRFFIPEDPLAQPSAEAKAGYRKVLYGSLVLFVATMIVAGGWTAIELLSR